MIVQRLLNRLHKQRENVINGNINCIPSPFKRFANKYPGIQQGRYYLVSASTKVGKSMIANYMFLYNPLLYSYYYRDKVHLKIFYFALEETPEDVTLRFMSYLLYVFDKIIITPEELQSIQENKPVDDEILQKLETEPYRGILEYYEECVDFQTVRHPTGIYSVIKDYCLKNGTVYYKDQEIVNNITGDKDIIKAFDYYVPNDDKLYFIPIIDHVSLLSPEKGMTIKQCIDLLSSTYLVKLRNRYNITPVVIQQQASDMESLDRIKSNKLRPTMNGLAESKLTARDCNVMLGLFSPYRHEIPEYLGYDVKKMKDHLRFLEVVINRGGESNCICPLYFLGQSNYFEELPLPTDERIERYYQKVQMLNLMFVKIINLFKKK